MYYYAGCFKYPLTVQTHALHVLEVCQRKAVFVVVERRWVVGDLVICTRCSWE
jgi:hypothetical protein